MNRPFVPTSIVLAAVLSGHALPVLADEASEVGRLHRAGQTAVAMQRADQFLSTRPDDAPMLFLRGVMLAESQRNAEAIEVFLKLTLDHPELAESHNNLAALHAAAGDYDKARVALEQALRANPNYATAHENLGDIHAMLASQAYARAAKLDPGNFALRPKIAIAQELFTPKGATPTPRPNTTP